MNGQPFSQAAKTYLDLIRHRGYKTTKKMRYIIMQFSGWMDDLINKQEEKERIRNEKKN